MNVERLALLARHIEENGIPEGYSLEGWENCAIGIAMQMPQFNQLGFRISATDTLWPHPYDEATGLRGYRAVEQFFQVAHDEARQLFSTYRYDALEKTNPYAVAQRINETIANLEEASA